MCSVCCLGRGTSCDVVGVDSDVRLELDEKGQSKCSGFKLLQCRLR